MNVFSFTEKMERGQYPINIPTSLALESLMNIHPETTHPSPPFQNYDYYWLNARTLYRNIISSFSSDVNFLLKPAIIAELMFDEYETIKRIIQEHSRITPTLYLSNYRKIESRYKKHTVFKTDTTPKQMEERLRMTRSIGQFLNDVGEDYVLQFDHDLEPHNSHGRFIIQTHIAVDLLSKNNFDDLDLLESHTGAIKNPSLWYTKFNNGKELSMIPFNHYFLRIFGDKEFFSPKDMKLRKDIIDLANQYHWNGLTTDARIRMNLDQLKNPFFRDVVKDMM